MKQTVSILTGLIAVVLLATGFIVADNIDLNQTVTQMGAALAEAQEQLVESKKQLKSQTDEMKTAAETLKKTADERDALSRQLNEAVLASQTAHELAQEQTRLNEAARFELEALKAEYVDLTKACAAMESQISALNRDAAVSAASHQQQRLTDAKRIAELERQLDVPPEPTPAPVVPIRQPERFTEY